MYFHAQPLSEREQFVNSCQAAAEYPENLVFSATREHTSKGYVKQLDERETKIFSKNEDLILDVLEYESPKEEFCPTRIRSLEGLRKLLNGKLELNKFDPRCRFAFVHAPSARDRLHVSREMLAFLFTYHQVLPCFLDFIFCFGRTQYARDFHFSGLRWINRMSITGRGLRIPELGRSGRDIHMCYSLKSVEPSKDRNSPWSIRQAAIYHLFDVETGIATWIVVKGNQLMKDRLEAATNSDAELSSFASNSKAFSATLATHLLFCDWCSEDWRWYIDYLEEEFQRKTRRTLSMDIASPTFQDSEAPFKFPLVEPPNHTSSGHLPPSMPKKPVRRQPPNSSPPALKAAPIAGYQVYQKGTVSFSNLQEIQFVEEKVNEVILVVNANIGVLTELNQEYKDVVVCEDCPQDISRNYDGSIGRFDKRILRITRDLLVVRSRAETLLKSLADRKELLHGILQLTNIEASSYLALKSKISADNMEKMTERMHEWTANMNELAQETKRETVSMRIITLVTLFFLPGTFISTIMSTDIIHFQPTESGGSGRIYDSAALKLYMEITIPLMLITFVAWYGVYKLEDQNDKKNPRRGHKGSV